MIRAVITALDPRPALLVLGRGARGRRRFSFVSVPEGPPVQIGDLVRIEIVITPDAQRARVLSRLGRAGGPA